MVKAFEWTFLAAVLAGAGYAFVELQASGGDALLGILGLLLFAAAASVLRLGHMHGRRIGTVLPIGVDWHSGLPEFTPHDSSSGLSQDARNDSTRRP